MNDFTLDELVRMIHGAEYVVRDIHLVDPEQVVIRATVAQPNFDNEASVLGN